MNLALQNVLLGASLLGLLGGVLGSFALLRRQSLLGDSVAHASLPGVVLAFVLTGSKEPMALLLGALAAGVAGALFILLVTRHGRIREDSAFGIVLSVFFGVGIVLLTWVQRAPGGNQTGLDRFLFGQAATLMASDLRLMALFGIPALLLVALLFKEFKLLSFDRGFAASLGRPVRGLEVLLTALLVLVVVLGLQTVGVILMVATLVAPAAAARQWTDDLSRMVPLAGLIGAAAGALGALASHLLPRMPTGPAIVLVASAAFAVSLLAAPRRGLVGALLRRRAVSQRIRRENLLKDLYNEGEAAGGARVAVPWARLHARRDMPPHCLRRAVRSLTRAGLVERAPAGLRLTAAGDRAAADVVRKHRLWETYLSRFLELDGEHVHRDAEDIEHVLGDAEVAALEERLGYPAVDPHGEPIPPRSAP